MFKISNYFKHNLYLILSKIGENVLVYTQSLPADFSTRCFHLNINYTSF
jgi:hypothetical protein